MYVYIYIYVCVHIYTHTHIHTYMHMNVDMHTSNSYISSCHSECLCFLPVYTLTTYTYIDIHVNTIMKDSLNYS